MCIARLTGILFILLAGPALAAANSVLMPGRWEVSIRTEAPVQSAPMIAEFCISKEKAEKPEPPKTDQKHDCKTVSGGLSGNTLAYVIKCSKRNAGSTSRFTFNGDRYEGVVEATIDGVTVRQVYTARRLGDCPEEENLPRP
jgi:Protein of unknown function (DUF3617)